MHVLGIDIGGSGVKGAPVDTRTGRLVEERFRLDTPSPSAPGLVAEVAAELVHHFNWEGPVGYGYPGVVMHGRTLTAANVDPGWIDVDAAALFAEATGHPAVVINDADAAGMAEMRFGAGRGRKGTVIVVTVGTGLGTALFYDGRLLPNAELGHIEIRGRDAELRASDRARQVKGYSWEQWAKRFNEYLSRLEALFWPDLFIIGGGASKRFDRFADRLTVRAEVVPAQMLNEAGIVGAALAGVPKPARKHGKADA